MAVLQGQMMGAMSMAVEKTQLLQKQLDKATFRIKELEATADER